MKRFSTDTLKLEKTTSNYFHLTEGFWYGSDVHPKAHLNKINEALLDHPILGLPSSLLKVEPFKTDLASVPWWVQWRLKKYGVYDFAAIVHDYLLQHRELFPELTRKQIDMIFREAMIDLGVPERECQLMYYGVRLNSYWKEERFYEHH